MDRVSKLTMTGIIVAGLLLKFISIFVAANISKSTMVDIYTQKVYVEGGEPQNLSYQLLFTIGLDFVFNIGILLILLLIGMFSIPGNNKVIILNFLLIYVLSILIIIPAGYFASSTIYNKKYFLYKDDGARAIRAYRDIIISFYIVVSLIITFLWTVMFNMGSSESSSIIDALDGTSSKVIQDASGVLKSKTDLESSLSGIITEVTATRTAGNKEDYCKSLENYYVTSQALKRFSSASTNKGEQQQKKK